MSPEENPSQDSIQGLDQTQTKWFPFVCTLNFLVNEANAFLRFHFQLPMRSALNHRFASEKSAQKSKTLHFPENEKFCCVL
jgi:hypothetical protein